MFRKEKKARGRSGCRRTGGGANTSSHRRRSKGKGQCRHGPKGEKKKKSVPPRKDGTGCIHINNATVEVAFGFLFQRNVFVVVPLIL
eukprot:scaffold8011_cov149-Amphora_coffeaeformis.AAC.3